jgi:acetylglutamate kinase
VIKIGGRSLEAPGALDELAAEVASLSDDALLVHGGGREVSDWCERFALEPRFVEGLRVTDPQTLEVVTAVLAGLANKRLVAGLSAAAVRAIGLSALDGGLVEVEPHPDAGRLGAVGSVRRVNVSLLRELLALGLVPVIASIGAADGALLNLNADDLAVAIAAALATPTLVLLSDAPGLVIDGGIVARLEASDLDAALAHRDVRDGMIVKLRAAKAALSGGVGRVRIGAWSGRGTLAALLGSDDVGTTVHRGDGRV